MMILLRLWLILSLSAAAPLNPKVDKKATEEGLVTDDIRSADIVNGDGVVSDEIHNHTSHNTSKNANRDAKHVFYGGDINFSGTIHSTGDHAHINIGSISSNAASHERHSYFKECPAYVINSEDCFCRGETSGGELCHAGDKCNKDGTCQPGCKAEEFSCSSGDQCVMQEAKCDGEPDCWDESDEMNCPNAGCKAEEFSCSSGDQCVVQEAKCDGEPDCWDESDEMNCPNAGIGKAALPCTFDDAVLSDEECDSEHCSPHDVSRAFKWENSKIPYYFTSTSDRDKQLFRSVMDIIERKTCFKFEEKTQAQYEKKHSLEITTGSESCATICKGAVGQIPYEKRLRLISMTQVNDREECKLQCQGFILHELMHALGVGHTFRRKDRDNFITVNEANLKSLNIQSLFTKCENCKLYPDIPYDCDSIMHYGTHINDKELMKPKDTTKCGLKKKAKLVDGPNGSDGDWKLLNIIGNCSGTPKDCWPVDKSVGKDKQWCTENCPNCSEDVCKCEVLCDEIVALRSSGPGIMTATLAIPLKKDITRYDIEMETNVPLTKFPNAASTQDEEMMNFELSGVSDLKAGQTLSLEFELEYEGSERLTFNSIVLDKSIVCGGGDYALAMTGTLEECTSVDTHAANDDQWCEEECFRSPQYCPETCECKEMSSMESIRGLRVITHLISENLKKMEKSTENENPSNFPDKTLDKATTYLKEHCNSENSECESVKIVDFKLESISKFKKIKASGKVSAASLKHFEESKERLDRIAAEQENKLKPKTKPAAACIAGPCTCENAAKPCKTGEYCTEGKCLEGCDVSNIKNGLRFLNKADCYCKENGGQICPKSFQGDKKSCGGGNVCYSNYGCTLKICPIVWILLG